MRSSPTTGGAIPRAGWLAIVAIASVLRLWPIGAGLPYIDYVDEGYVLHQSIKLLQERTYDVGLYDYPPLPCYLVAGAVLAATPVSRLIYHADLQQGFPPASEFHTKLGEAYDLISPPALIVLGRLVVALLSIGAVILTGLLARSIAGRGEALTAMLLLAVCPAAVSRGSIVIVDTVATFFALATVCLCAQFRVRHERDARHAWRLAAAAGAAAALGFVSKYTIGAVAAAVLVTVLTLHTTLGAKLRLLFVGALAFVATSLLLMPALVRDSAGVIANWAYQFRSYDELRSDVGYFRAALAKTELGVPLVVAGVIGLALLVSKQNTRAAVLSWLAFAGVLLAGIITSSFQPFRNVLSLVPLVCIGAAVLLAHLQRRLAKTQRFSPAVARLLIAAAIVLLATSLALPASQQVAARIAEVDTRTRAVDWLQKNVHRGERILVIREVAILPSEWKRVPATTEVVAWFDAISALEREPFDYIVTGDPDLRLATDPAGWAAYRERWQNAVGSLPAAAQFGDIPMFIAPYLWRTNDERIMILKTH